MPDTSDGFPSPFAGHRRPGVRSDDSIRTEALGCLHGADRCVGARSEDAVDLNDESIAVQVLLQQAHPRTRVTALQDDRVHLPRSPVARGPQQSERSGQ